MRKWKHFPTVIGDSPIATVIGDDNDWRSAPERTEKVSRLVVHMTGSSIVESAIRKGVDPYEHALSYYTGKGASSHYLLGYDGQLFQMTDDRLRVGHVGVTGRERQMYLRGAWERQGLELDGKAVTISKDTVAFWKQAWPFYKSPQHLFGSQSINDCSVGVEMPPCGRYVHGKWESLLGVQRHSTTRHTVQQHVGVALLACDVARRWGWTGRWWIDPHGGPRTPYLPGHEDVDLYGRSQRSGGWDPGALREQPYWDWGFVQHTIPAVLTVLDALGSITAAYRRVMDRWHT